MFFQDIRTDIGKAWENYSPEPPFVFFPVFRSTDGGFTWIKISEVHDEVNHFGLRYQPFLYLLSSPIAHLPAGALLLAGNSIPQNLSSTHIDLYSSLDSGLTWSFVSHIASGGEAIPDNGLTPIWEPFLLLFQGSLVAFYSDQRDPLHGQKLVHQVSHNLIDWEAPVDDVAYANFTDRPGMTTVSELPNGKFMMTYEFGGGFQVADPNNLTYGFPAYYRIADSPLEFNNAVGLPIISQDGTQPQSSPYNVWTPVGGPDGTIMVSTGTFSEIFVNRKLGDVDAWVKVATPESTSYSRSLRVLGAQKDSLLLIGGGVLPPATDNSVTISVMNLEGGKVFDVGD